MIPVVRVRAVARGFTSERFEGDGHAPLVGRTRDPGELFELPADEVALATDAGGGWMECATPADQEALDEYRARFRFKRWRRSAA